MLGILRNRAMTRRFLAIVLTIPIYLSVLGLGGYLIIDGNVEAGIALIGIPTTAASTVMGFFFRDEASNSAPLPEDN